MLDPDPLLQHFIDIVTDKASGYLILAGGFGLYIKRLYVERVLLPSGQRTLIQQVPRIRSTIDLDFFLKLEVFTHKDAGKSIRALLDRLEYDERTPKMQFHKPLGPDFPGREICVDFLAREPGESSAEEIRVTPPRVGTGAGIDLHGRVTPEAFAVEDSPIQIALRDILSEAGGGLHVLVPHPYPWLCMKTAAARDWLRMQRGDIREKANSAKHLLDAYIIVAMITEPELEGCKAFQGRHRSQQGLQQLFEAGQELFRSANAVGFEEAAKQSDITLDHATFWEGYRAVLGIEEAPQ